jgi:hypothetical protein
MVENIGEIPIHECDDANIPVNIFITPPDEDDKKWHLRADNFMPRKCTGSEGAYQVASDTREELVALVEKYIVPLYSTAFNQLANIVKGTANDLYYWKLDNN